MARHYFFPLLAGAILALGGCNASSEKGADGASAEKGSLAGYKIGAPFTLTDQNGKKRSWDEFNGQYRIVYFGYSYCPDVCPVDLQHIAQGFAAFEKAAPQRAAKVQPLFISLDPERDTPETLKNYVSAFHPRLIGLTGTPEEIAVVAKNFAIVYMKEKPKDSTDYLVSHSRTPYLFGPDGKPLALIPVDDPVTPDVDEGVKEEVTKMLDHWVK